jgi:cell division protein FtsZ
MAIGEFEEVGNTIREFASDDATVVIGTVIDPEMKGDMRVTMVATGIGQGAKRGHSPKLADSSPRTTDYDSLDTPTVIRNRRGAQQAAALIEETNVEYLDIPAFLRRQAD